jgi:DNA-binding transcriptional MerR regulator
MSMIELSIGELETKLGVPRRVVHSWVARGLLPPPLRRGPKTRYDEATVLRIRAIGVLRARRMGLDAIKRWLLTATRDQLEALVRPPAPPQAAAPVIEPLASSAERWERVKLVPGLELHVELGAGQLVRRLAREIVEHYGALPSAELDAQASAKGSATGDSGD